LPVRQGFWWDGRAGNGCEYPGADAVPYRITWNGTLLVRMPLGVVTVT
jgi:hypothetical protein